LISNLKIQDLEIGYANQSICKNISMDILENEFIALVGKNGQGKSTFLKTLCGLLTPISGKISFNDKPIQRLSIKEKSKIFSVLFTEKLNLNHITVYDFVAFGRYPYINWYGKINLQDKLNIEKAIEICKITNLKNKYYNELSDGEKQKVNIARVVSQNLCIVNNHNIELMENKPPLSTNIINQIFETDF